MREAVLTVLSVAPHGLSLDTIIVTDESYLSTSVIQESLNVINCLSMEGNQF